MWIVNQGPIFILQVMYYVPYMAVKQRFVKEWGIFISKLEPLYPWFLLEIGFLIFTKLHILSSQCSFNRLCTIGCWIFIKMKLCCFPICFGFGYSMCDAACVMQVKLPQNILQTAQLSSELEHRIPSNRNLPRGGNNSKKITSFSPYVQEFERRVLMLVEAVKTNDHCIVIRNIARLKCCMCGRPRIEHTRIAKYPI